ncbi:MAG: hypothetical protein ACTSXH_13975 [Promethearchaeota archaeon]
MSFHLGVFVYDELSRRPLLSSGDRALDELLSGGFHRDLVYLLYGDKEITTNILLTTAVIAQKAPVNGGLGEHARVAFVEADNRFNPYTVSRFAVSQKLSPQKVLENILIARAFTWDQMVELLEHRLAKLEDVKVVLISGITSLFQASEQRAFEDLLRAIGGIKKILEKANPLIVLTAPLHENSIYRPKGGKYLAHFGNVLVLIKECERYVEYVLVQHPFMPKKRYLKWKPRESKRKLSNPLKNTTLDCWF